VVKHSPGRWCEKGCETMEDCKAESTLEYHEQDGRQVPVIVTTWVSAPVGCVRIEWSADLQTWTVLLEHESDGRVELFDYAAEGCRFYRLGACQ
jgi:hypothetical protein